MIEQQSADQLAEFALLHTHNTHKHTHTRTHIRRHAHDTTWKLQIALAGGAHAKRLKRMRRQQLLRGERVGEALCVSGRGKPDDNGRDKLNFMCCSERGAEYMSTDKTCV